MSIKELIKSFFFCLLVVSGSVLGYDKIDLTKIPESQRELGLSEFYEIEMLSFDDTKKIGWGSQEAWVWLRSKTQKAAWYRVTPFWNNAQKIVLFVTPESCTQEGHRDSYAVIYVEDVAVSATSFCSKEDDKLKLAFTAKTRDGESHIHQSFRENTLVKIKFNRRTIIFDTAGFDAALDSLGSSPL